MKKIPNFFIVGAPRTGTTSLYFYLKSHPQVYMSPIKEPNFFAKDLKLSDFRGGYKEPLMFNLNKYFSKKVLDFVHLAYITDIEMYLKLYKDVKNEIAIGEASTSYLYSKVAAKEIYKFNNDAKIIILLRNPVERAFSHYLMNLQIGLTDNFNFLSDFYQDLKVNKKGWGISHLYFELGLYYEMVNRYLEIFPKENVKIIIFEEFKKKPKKVFWEILKFLNLRKDYNVDLTKKYNISNIPKNPKLHKKIKFIAIPFKRILPDKIKNKIKNFYNKFIFVEKKIYLTKKEKSQIFKFFENDINKLEHLLNMDLSIWKENNDKGR